MGALGIFPLALAIDQPKRQCANFLTVRIIQKHSAYRRRRSPMELDGLFDLTSSDDEGYRNRGRRSPMGGSSRRRGSYLTNGEIFGNNERRNRNRNRGTTTTSPPKMRGLFGFDSEEVSGSGDDAQTNAPTTEPGQTTDSQTNKPTTNAATTTIAVDTTVIDSTVSDATTGGSTENKKAIIVMLDETGSMQNIGGKAKGRQLVVNKMEKFRQMLQKKVQKDRVENQEITFVTFNTHAKWTSYDSIDQWPRIHLGNYNPGYQTNLFDTMGCVLSEFRSRNPNTDASVYLISDGVHAMNRKMRNKVAYKLDEVNEMVEELRNEGWNFNFYGATDVAGKDELKDHAIDLGFRAAETLVFDFNGKQFGALLKSMLSSITEKDDKKQTQIPKCEECKKGKAGKICRQKRKNQINAGLCVKA